MIVVEKLAGIVETHDKVVRFTQSIFPGSVTISRESDPECSAEYFVVSAAATGEVEEIAALHHQWHAILGDVAGESAHDYRLSLQLS